MEQIGLEAVLKDADFQKGLAAYLQGVDKATSKTQEGAQGMSVMERASGMLGDALGGVATIAAGVLTAGIVAATAAITGFVFAAKTGISTTATIAEDLDTLGDKFGLSAEQAGGWSYLMQRVGLSVEEGSSGFSFFIKGLDSANDRLKAGKKELTPFEQSLKKLGISAFDTKGNLKTFEQVLPEIQSSLKKMQDGTAKSALEMELFGKSGGKFHDFLTQDMSLKQALQAVDEKGLKLTDEQVQASIDLGIAQRDLDASIKGIWNQIGIAVLPTLKDMAQLITKEVLPAFSKWVKEHAPQINAALKELGKWMKDVALPALMQLASRVQKELIPAIASFIGWVTENFPKVQKAIQDAMKAIKPIIDKIVSLFAQASDTDLSGIVKAWQSVQKAIDTAWKFIKPILDKVFKEISKFWTEIQPKLKKAWDNIEKVTKEAWDFIWNKVIKPIVTAIQKFIDDHMEDILKIIKGVWKEIEGVFEVAWAAIQGIVKVALDILGGDMDAAGKDWQDMMTAIWAGIEKIIDGAWDIIQGIVAAALAALWQIVNDKMNQVYNTIANIWNNAVTAVRNAGTNLYNAGRDAIQSLINGINSLVNNIKDAILAPFIGAINTLITTNWGDVAKNIISALVNGIVNIAWQIKDAILGPFVSAIQAILNTDWGAVGRRVMEMIAGGLEAIKNRIVSAIQGPMQQLIDLIQSLLHSLYPSSGFGALGSLGAMQSQSIPSVAGMAASSSFVSNRSTINNFNMTVNTQSAYSTVTRDFGIMRALVGG